MIQLGIYTRTIHFTWVNFSQEWISSAPIPGCPPKRLSRLTIKRDALNILSFQIDMKAINNKACQD